MDQPTLNTWTSLFLITSFIGTFLGSLLLVDKGSRKYNWPIAMILYGMSMIIVFYVLIWSGYRAQFPYAYFFDAAWYLAFGPLLYCYVTLWYKPGKTKTIFHFIPAVIVFLLSIYYLFPTHGFTNTSSVSNEILFQLYWKLRNPWLGIFSLFFYLWILRDYVATQAIEKERSELSRIRKKWLDLLLTFFSFFSGAYLSYYVLVMFPFFNTTWDYAISMTMTLGIFGLGYFVYSESRIFNGEVFTALFRPTKKRAILSESTKNEFFQSIKSHIDSNKSYKNHELRMVHLADSLGYPCHVLSQIINEKTGANFNAFINNYRLEEAIYLLQYSDRKISAICFDIGFNSKGSFYSAFKKKYNCTPMAYRLNHSQG